jgi:hypothetical protein
MLGSQSPVCGLAHTSKYCRIVEKISQYVGALGAIQCARTEVILENGLFCARIVVVPAPRQAAK